jgi:hypothetical protein
VWLFALPVVLSIDNLAAIAPADQAPVLALSSTAMAALGLALGALGRVAAARLWHLAEPAQCSWRNLPGASGPSTSRSAAPRPA